MPAITCPHCGAATGYIPVARRKYVEKDTPGNYIMANRVTGAIFDDESGYFFSVARCQACGMPFPVRGKTDSPDNPDHPDLVPRTTFEPLWPTRFRSVSKDIPSPIREAMEDASAALGAKSIIGAMSAAYTAVERTQRQKKEELKLAEGSLKALVEYGIISRSAFEGSAVARRWDNFLKHGKVETLTEENKLTINDAEELYIFVEELLDELYLAPKRIQEYEDSLKKQRK